MGLLEKHPGRNIGDIKDNLSVELSDYVYLPRKPFTNSSGYGCAGSAYGDRTRISALRGPCPNRLDERANGPRMYRAHK
jgi:hypothetical protein